MRPRRRINAGLVLIFLTAAAAAEDDVRRWRDADGKVHVEIVGEEGARPAARAPADDAAARFSTETSLRRRRIERALEETFARLRDKRVEIRETEETHYLVARLPTPADEEERQRVSDLTRSALLAADAFEDQKRRRLFFLRRAERELLFDLDDLWQDWERLRDEVRAYYGELPSWWIGRVRCGGCPRPEEIAAELRRTEVEVVTTADPTPTPGSAP